MEILGIDHLGMVAKDHEQAVKFFNKILGLKSFGSEKDSFAKVDVSFLSSFSTKMSADTRLELLQDEGGGPIQRYKEKFGGGIHHIAFKVDSVEDYFNYFKTENIQLISEAISYGAGGHKIFSYIRKPQVAF